MYFTLQIYKIIKHTDRARAKEVTFLQSVFFFFFLLSNIARGCATISKTIDHIILHTLVY